MDSRALAASLAAFDDELPLERASTPPAAWYQDAAFEELESAVFRRSWQLVGRADQVAAVGDFISGVAAGHPWLVVRTQAGLRAFHNVCRHKGTPVAVGAEGHCEQLRCPYHGWVYGLDGALLRAPKLGAIQDFERSEMGLRPAAVSTWGPLLLVALDATTPPLPVWLGLLAHRLEETGWSSLRHRASGRYELECNWKVFCDNYLDGGYHLPTMHPGLASQLDMSRYATELVGRGSVQSCPGVDEVRVGDEAVYVWVYPNLMLNRYGPVLDTNLVLPLGPERCEVRFEYFFEDGVSDAFVESSMRSTDETQREDVEISEWVQKGLRSPAFDTGRYAPAHEKAIFHFHRMLATDLRKEFSHGG